MAEAYLGEIRMVGFPYAPEYWANADGQLLEVSTYSALYSLYGTIYGGDGRTTFALPDLRGRVPIHVGHGSGFPSYEMGSKGGATSVVLDASQIPAHTHPAAVHAQSGSADQESPAGSFWAEPTRSTIYGTEENATMNENAVEVGANSGGQAHVNMQPYLTIRFCVCMNGIYPPRP